MILKLMVMSKEGCTWRLSLSSSLIHFSFSLITQQDPLKRGARLAARKRKKEESTYPGPRGRRRVGSGGREQRQGGCQAPVPPVRCATVIGQRSPPGVVQLLPLSPAAMVLSCQDPPAADRQVPLPASPDLLKPRRRLEPVSGADAQEEQEEVM